MLKLTSISTKEGMLSKKQSSRSFIHDIIHDLTKKKESLIDNLNKELEDIPIMQEKYYEICSKNYYSNLDIIKQENFGKIPRYIDPKEYDKEAKRIIKWTSYRLKTSKKNSIPSYKVVQNSYRDENNNICYNYQDFNGIVEAGLFIYQKEKMPKIRDIEKELRRAENGTDSYDINQEYKQISIHDFERQELKVKQFKFEYKMASTPKMDDILNELKPLIEKYYEYRKSIVMFERISAVISKNMNNGKKHQIIEKITKEKKLFEIEAKKLYSQINNLEKQLESELEKAKNQDKSNTNGIKKEVPNQRNNVDNQKKDENKKKRIDELKKLREEVETIKKQKNSVEVVEGKRNLEQQVSSPKIISQFNTDKIIEQADLYQKYKEIRNKLDEIIERKNEFSNEAYYEQEIVNTFYPIGLGTNYNEIIKNIQDMRRELEVTKEIDKAIDSVKMEYTNIEEMHQIDFNGLTNFENRIINRLISLSTNPEIPDDLRNEISYYIRKHKNLESQISFIIQNKQMYPEEMYTEIINNYKITHYINTNLIDEIEINKEENKSK